MRLRVACGLGVSACLLLAALAPAPAGAGQKRAVTFETVRPPSGDTLELFDLPGGHVIASERTSLFGGPLVLGVVGERGSWAEVTSELLPDGKVAWVNLKLVDEGSVATAIRVELGARRLELLRDGKLERSFAVAVGAPGSPTPTGRFAVAEKLPGSSVGSAYGCCVLALTARQETPPAGWSGNATWLVAIHGGGGIGTAVSGGCLHLPDAALRYLMRNVPLGTPVFITP